MADREGMGPLGVLQLAGGPLPHVADASGGCVECHQSERVQAANDRLREMNQQMATEETQSRTKGITQSVVEGGGSMEE